MNLAIFYFFFNLSSIHSIANLAIFFSYSPFVMYVGPVVAILLVLIFSKNKTRSLCLLALSGALAWILAYYLKLFFHIPRPFVSLKLIPLVSETDFSFPSEHAAIAFAVATSSYFLNRKVGIIMFLAAILISISRLIIGLHYPSDIIAGGILGFLSSRVLIYFYKKL